MNKYHGNDAIHISQVAIRVLDIKASINYYKNTLGFEVIRELENTVEMGFDNRVLLVLKQAKTPKQVRAAGLYHVAYLVPKRSDLANWLYYHLKNKTSIDGASNHAVSEAIYLRDIDGNGIEIYTDTPSETWVWDDSQVHMVTDPLDIEDLFTEVTTPTHKLPNDTFVGHLHLSVLDLEESQKFYHALGLNTVLNMGSAAFLSSKEYHHHLGMNVWGMAMATPHNNEQADLDFFVIRYGSKDQLDEILKNMDSLGYRYEMHPKYVEATDNNGIKSHLIY